MAEKVLSIEIGPMLTKVIETERGSGSIVYDAFYFSTPEGTIENGIVKNNPQFKLRLEEGLRLKNIKTKKVVFIIQATSIGTKEELLPKLGNSKIKEYIKTNSSTFFPVNSEQYKIIHRENGSMENGQIRAQLFAISKELIASYEALSEFCQLNLLDIELLENGITKTIREEYPTGLVVSIAVESVCSYLTIVKNGEIMLQRMIPYGIDEAVKAVQEENYFGNDLPFDIVLDKMHDEVCFEKHVSDIDAIKSEVKASATEEVRYAIGNITRLLDHFMSQHEEEKIDKVIASGLGTYCKGFAELLANEINRELVLADSTFLKNIVNKNNVRNLGIYFSTLSACSNADGTIINSVSEKKKGINFDSLVKSDDDFSLAKKIMILCLIIALILIFVAVGFKIYYSVKTSNAEDEIASMKEAKGVNDEYQKTLKKYNAVVKVDDLSSVSNDAFLDLLGEMEANIPTDVVVSGLTADSSGVIIDFNAPSLHVMASTIAEFRKFNTVGDLEVSGYTSEINEMGVASYSFSIKCYYKDQIEDAESNDSNSSKDSTSNSSSSNSSSKSDTSSSSKSKASN